MTGKPELISFLVQQDVKTKLDVIDALMESLSPIDHEMAIYRELEWLSPYGRERAKEKLADLDEEPGQKIMFDPCDGCTRDCSTNCDAKIKKDTAKVPEESIQDNLIRKGDKVRVNKGEDFGYSFEVAYTMTGMVSDAEHNWFDAGLLVKYE